MFDAAREGNAELLLAAIDAGLPPNLTDPKGTFSFSFSLRLIQYLISLVPYASQNKNVISLNYYYNKSHRFSKRKSTGNTLLMLAAYAGHAELVRDLIQRGADPNRLNDLGQAPIAGAVFKREDEVVRVLVEAGADPRVGEPNAIASARMFGRTDLLGMLGASG
jgi:uncharacterized protein